VIFPHNRWSLDLRTSQPSILTEQYPAFGRRSIPQNVVVQLKPILTRAGLLAAGNLDDDVVATNSANIPSGSISDDDNDQSLLDIRTSQPSKSILVAKRRRQNSFVIEDDSDASDQSAENPPKSPTVARCPSRCEFTTEFIP
jgi:hypothetical protein